MKVQHEEQMNFLICFNKKNPTKLRKRSGLISKIFYLSELI
jgi:hypothetical protein